MLCFTTSLAAARAPRLTCSPPPGEAAGSSPRRPLRAATTVRGPPPSACCCWAAGSWLRHPPQSPAGYRLRRGAPPGAVRHWRRERGTLGLTLWGEAGRGGAAWGAAGQGRQMAAVACRGGKLPGAGNAPAAPLRGAADAGGRVGAAIPLTPAEGVGPRGRCGRVNSGAVSYGSPAATARESPAASAEFPGDDEGEQRACRKEGSKRRKQICLAAKEEHYHCLLVRLSGLWQACPEYICSQWKCFCLTSAGFEPVLWMLWCPDIAEKWSTIYSNIEKL